jgi:choline dehydrogenase-like flavoprotein
VVNTERDINNDDGTRQYSAATYLKLAAGRSNIQVLTGAQATKIQSQTVKGQFVATGVEFVANGKTYTVPARKEVILSAGS